MMIAETRSFELGPFSVQQRPRQDNPAFAVYIISRASRFIGKSFSCPDLECCRWLEREHGHQSGGGAIDPNIDRRKRGRDKARLSTVKTSVFSRFRI